VPFASACDNIKVGGSACATDRQARPDLVFCTPWVTLVIEVDEDSHAAYEGSCEVSRYESLAHGMMPSAETPEGYMRPQIVLRVNPDVGMPGAPPFKVRMKLLAERILRFFAVSSWDDLVEELGVEPFRTVTVSHICFLHYGRGGQKHIDAARKAEEDGAAVKVLGVVV